MFLLTLTLGWKIVFIVTILAFTISVGLYIKGCLDADEAPFGVDLPYINADLSDGTPSGKTTIIVDKEDCEKHFTEEDEFFFDSTIKEALLRNKLNKIEEERQQEK
jgi:hypothetical protein